MYILPVIWLNPTSEFVSVLISDKYPKNARKLAEIDFSNGSRSHIYTGIYQYLYIYDLYGTIRPRCWAFMGWGFTFDGFCSSYLEYKYLDPRWKPGYCTCNVLYEYCTRYNVLLLV